MQMTILALDFSPCAAMQAQTYAQPVREVENVACTSITCSMLTEFSAGGGEKQCNLCSVPAGKRLEIKQAKATILLPIERLASYSLH